MRQRIRIKFRLLQHRAVQLQKRHSSIHVTFQTYPPEATVIPHQTHLPDLVVIYVHAVFVRVEDHCQPLLSNQVVYHKEKERQPNCYWLMQTCLHNTGYHWLTHPNKEYHWLHPRMENLQPIGCTKQTHIEEGVHYLQSTIHLFPTR